LIINKQITGEMEALNGRKKGSRQESRTVSRIREE
jgi:hypothetical protein